MKILVLYHYYFPDDVVSAAHYTGLCEGLAHRGFTVEVWPANRPCHPLTMDQREAGAPKRYSTRPEERNGVKIHRVWRLPLRQHSFPGRILNAVWMAKRWWLRLALSPGLQPDVILIGTDPLFSVILAPWLRFLRPKARIVHWCFDLYPEAAIADNLFSESSAAIRVIRYFLRKGYKACGLVADIGSCMRKKLENYGIEKSATLTPWALEEPPQALAYDKGERAALFGGAPLGLLYSGNLGRAHDFALTLELARRVPSFVFTYSARGSRLKELKKSLTHSDTNIRFAEFAPPMKLSARLCAPDLHIVSLRPGWAGVVVPSKFFGALAVGRPILFEGPEDSAISRWIKEYGLGWVLTPATLDEIAEDLLRFSVDEKRKKDMFKHCHGIYGKYFSKKAVVDGWEREIRALLS